MGRRIVGDKGYSWKSEMGNFMRVVSLDCGEIFHRLAEGIV